MLRLLRDGGPQPVQVLADPFDMRRPSLSEHPKVLREAGLVSEQRSGRQRIHRLEAAPLAEVQDWLQPYERFWRGRLKDLGALLDRTLDDGVTRATHPTTTSPSPNCSCSGRCRGRRRSGWRSGHRYTMTSVPRPDANFSGTVEVEVLAHEPQRMPSLRWADVDSANSAHWTVTWNVEQEGCRARLFLVHEGFESRRPAQPRARTIMDGGWRTHVMRALGHMMERI